MASHSSRVNFFTSDLLTVILIAPLGCGTEVPPRLCDPPCSEKQAGIGPIPQKPELLTLDRRLVAVDQMCKVRPASVSCRSAHAVNKQTVLQISIALLT